MAVKPTIKVLVTGLDPRHVAQPATGAGATSAQAATTQELVLPADATVADVYNELKASGHKIVDLGYKLDRHIGISTTDESLYDSTAPGGLQVGRNTTLLEFNHQLRNHDGRDQVVDNGKTAATAKKGQLQVGDVSIEFNRTLRVPDDGKVHLVPVDLGHFPLKPVAECSNVPAWIASRGGFVLPIAQREAMWMGFPSDDLGSRGKDHAVKVHVGGINALSGLPRDADESQIDPEFQDYLVSGKQHLLDGICTEPGVVRQFVAMPLGKGYTVEEQLTGKAEVGGIQFDIFERLYKRFEIIVTRDGEEHVVPSRYLVNTPAEISLENEQPVKLRLRRGTKNSLDVSVATLLKAQGVHQLDGPAQLVLDSGYSTSQGYYPKPQGMHVMVLNLEGETFPIGIYKSDTVERLKEQIEDAEGVPVKSQRLICRGRRLEDGRTLSDYGICNGDTLHLVFQLAGGASTTMGIAAGGKIQQNIVMDRLSARMYSKEPSHRVFVHTVNSAMWELMTGTVCPPSLIAPSTYKDNNLPWFDIYSETTSTSQAGRFSDVRSLTEVDTILSKAFDPSRPPPCSSHTQILATVVYRPCGHFGCDDCLFAQLDLITVHGSRPATGICQICRADIDLFVGVQRPVDWATLEEMRAMAGEKEIKGVVAGEEEETSAWTVRLKQDYVNGPLGRKWMYGQLGVQLGIQLGEKVE